MWFKYCDFNSNKNAPPSGLFVVFSFSFYLFFFSIFLFLLYISVDVLSNNQRSFSIRKLVLIVFVSLSILDFHLAAANNGRITRRCPGPTDI